jgi:hypothetical protein
MLSRCKMPDSSSQEKARGLYGQTAHRAGRFELREHLHGCYTSLERREINAFAAR